MLALHGRKHDDASALSALRHPGRERTDGVGGTNEVVLDDAVELPVFGFDERLEVLCRGVGDDNVDFAELLDSLVVGRAKEWHVADVSRQLQALAAVLLDETAGLL